MFDERMIPLAEYERLIDVMTQRGEAHDSHKARVFINVGDDDPKVKLEVGTRRH